MNEALNGNLISGDDFIIILSIAHTGQYVSSAAINTR
jgi:hypothetical protein